MIKSLVIEVVSESIKPLKVVEVFPNILDEFDTVRQAIQISRENFTIKERIYIYSRAIFKVALIELITFLFCCFIVEPITSSFLCFSKVPFFISLIISVYITSKRVPILLGELCIN